MSTQTWGISEVRCSLESKRSSLGGLTKKQPGQGKRNKMVQARSVVDCWLLRNKSNKKVKAHGSHCAWWKHFNDDGQDTFAARLRARGDAARAYAHGLQRCRRRLDACSGDRRPRSCKQRFRRNARSTNAQAGETLAGFADFHNAPTIRLWHLIAA
jgi:hypothetical protein